MCIRAVALCCWECGPSKEILPDLLAHDCSSTIGIRKAAAVVFNKTLKSTQAPHINTTFLLNEYAPFHGRASTARALSTLSTLTHPTAAALQHGSVRPNPVRCSTELILTWCDVDCAGPHPTDGDAVDQQAYGAPLPTIPTTRLPRLPAAIGRHRRWFQATHASEAGRRVEAAHASKADRRAALRPCAPNRPKRSGHLARRPLRPRLLQSPQVACAVTATALVQPPIPLPPPYRIFQLILCA
jgi:hypothetical protein